MILKNQTLMNRLGILLDGVLLFAAMPLAYWARVLFFDNGSSQTGIPLYYYLIAVLCLVPIQLTAYNLLGLYKTHSKYSIYYELSRMFLAGLLCFMLLPATFFVIKIENFSRGALIIFFLLETLLLGGKRILIWYKLRTYRRKGHYSKSILIVGSGEMAANCEHELLSSPELGYVLLGYISSNAGSMRSRHLGNISDLRSILEQQHPDEVIAALDVDEYADLPLIISACEDWGIRFSLIPCYAKYIPTLHPQVDFLNGIPLFNLRHIPLDNMANAFLKRSMDVIGSLILILITSPIMLAAAIGVKLSSPGPILFKQARVGYGKKVFYMYKFRSMRVNTSENTGWSTNTDPRRTRFGSFIRKYSIDELPQFFNVLKGDMSLIGPRPELPHFVEKFRTEIPQYMVKHQVRPGITGWAQVHGLRGDTSIEDRIKHDVYYIENWSLLLDIQILFMTVKHVSNDETIVSAK